MNAPLNTPMIANKLGPFRLYAARDVVDCLSREARNVRTIENRDGLFVEFDLPSGAKIWR